MEKEIDLWKAPFGYYVLYGIKAYTFEELGYSENDWPEKRKEIALSAFLKSLGINLNK